MSKRAETSIIVVNWNGLELLKILLPSIFRQTYRDFELILVDNGSIDKSLEFIEKRYPQAVTVKLDKNYGFAAGVNRGIEKSEGKFIVLINNDTELDKDCLNYLVEAAKRKKETGFIAAKMLNFYKRGVIDSCGDYIDAVGHANNIGLGEKDRGQYRSGEVFLVTGGGSLIKRGVIESAGMFDEDFFMYFEDVDFCLRAQLKGFRGYFEEKAKIYHIHKASSGKVKPLTEYLQFRNLTYTILKDFPRALLLYKLNFIRIILVNINTVRFLAAQGYLREALRADFYILLHLPQILSKRSKIQNSKVVGSEYIIKNIREKRITFFGLIKGGI